MQTPVPVPEGRRWPAGADLHPDGGVHFRVWAPGHGAVSVVLEGGPGSPASVALQPEPDGYFAARVPTAGPGTRYRYRLDGGDGLYPDPASRFQPDGPHRASEVIDPGAFRWDDADWPGVKLDGQVITEIHIGTFTPEGTWGAAAEKLPLLADVGITCAEVMPVAEFPGRFGWGYDGVHLYAPTRLYGPPDHFRAFVARAHALGLGVILDVVYNHLGPDGNYSGAFAPPFFTDRYRTDWGAAINYDGPDAGPVRAFIAANAAYWVAEYHLDGLRLDATQNIYDGSGRHILADVGAAARAAAGRRSVLLVAENEPQHVKLVRPIDRGGYGLDALWNDDYHHTAYVALTGRAEAYYTDYRGTPQEFVSAAKYGYLYQGQWYEWQKKRRGTPGYGAAPATFVTFLENHDQVANSARGARAHQLAHPGRYRALTALTLLGPGTPMLFQGQEFASSRPFFYFADHNPDLAKLVCRGRAQFLAQFPSVARPDVQASLPDPADPQTFRRCVLDWAEWDRNTAAVALHRDLLRLRREDPAFRGHRPGGVDGAVLSPSAFVLRFFHDAGDEEQKTEGGGQRTVKTVPGLSSVLRPLSSGLGDRLLLVNLGPDLDLRPAPEPLLAPPEGCRWDVIWSSEDPRYGGGGTPLVEFDGWHLLGEAAVVLAPRPEAGEDYVV
jgi:maltooligosyltrehalose trehalohydrolase